jgi:hypothetical protein
MSMPKYISLKSRYLRGRMSPQPTTQRGLILIWMLLGMTAIFGGSALAVDGSYWLERRAEAQRVADCAALTYAYVYSTQGSSAATTAYDTLLTNCGYAPGDTTNNRITYPYKSNVAWFNVHVGREESQMFTSPLGVGAQTIDAASTAEYVQPSLSTINPPNDFGIANGNLPVVLQVNGPDDNIREGDNYSSIYAVSSSTAIPPPSGTLNTLHETFKGYLFQIDVPAQYIPILTANYGGQLEVQVYDPEYDDVNGSVSSWPDMDQIYDSGSINFTLENPDFSVIKTDTYTQGTSYTPNPKNAWVTPTGFTVNVSSGGNVSASGSDSANAGDEILYLNVQATSGDSQDGFLLRAGPVDSNIVAGETVNSSGTSQTTVSPWADTLTPPSPASSTTTGDPIYQTSWYTEYNNNKTYAVNPTGTGGDFSTTNGRVTWHQAFADGPPSVDPSDNPPGASPDYIGASVDAVGVLPIIFTANGSGTLTLGEVPTGSTSVTINDFDAGDEGSTTKALYYECSSISGSGSDGLEHWAGAGFPTADGGGYSQTITLPTNYTTGVWYAYYESSVEDMSTWNFTYVGPQANNGLGTVGLIATSTNTLD